jgi:hypothetical protein
MQKLTEQHRSPTVDRALRFFIVRAKGRPETAAFATEAQAVRTRLRERRDAYLDAQDERLALSAEVVYLDGRLDRLVVVHLKRDVAAFAADRSGGAQYERKLFQGMAPSKAMQPVGGEKQEHYVASIIQRLENDADYAFLSDHAPRLRAAQQALDAALERRKTARVKERLAQGDLDDMTDEARRFYNQLYPRLQLVFTDDLPLVESYFRELRRARDEEGEEDEEDETPPDEGKPKAEGRKVEKEAVARKAGGKGGKRGKGGEDQEAREDQENEEDEAP